MTLRNLLLIFSLSLLLPACEFKCSVGDTTSNEKTKPVVKNGIALYNGIQLDAKGVIVKKAYLVTDDGTFERIDDGNFVDIKKGVKLILEISDGWKEANDRVMLGASLLITTEAGKKVLEEEDLFAGKTEEGLSAKDARTLGMSVYFTNPRASGPATFDVHFRVWDKKGDGSITGSYTIQTK